MLKRNSKSIIGLILVIALVFSMFPILPSSVAYAAATNLLPSSLTLNTNIKASSQNSTRTASHIGDNIFWTLSGSKNYSTTTTTAYLWAAIDLGSSNEIAGLNFHTTTNDVNTQNRSSQYEVSYSDTITPWNTLPALNNNVIGTSPSGWTRAAIVPTTAPAGTTVTKGTYSYNWSLDDDTGYYTSSLSFTTPIKARYILINYTLNPNQTGQVGIGSLRIIPTISLSSSTGNFYSKLQNTVSTNYSIDSSSNGSFTSITNGANPLVQGTDYTLGANNLVTFSNAYLNSLNGKNNLNFNFSSSQGPIFVPFVLTQAAAADSSLSPQGAAYMLASSSIISTTMNLNGNQFTNISDGASILPASNYVFSGNTVSFNENYLNTLSLGVHPLSFNFDGGNPQTFRITISNSAPAANIDYRYWTLQEPLPGGAGQTSQTLQAGYADPYFYVGADGSQVFMDTAVGGTTSGSAHPRSELREYDPMAGTDAGWLPVGVNTMTNTVAVSTYGTLNGIGWTAIGQIFDSNVTTLLELQYGFDPTQTNKGNFRILYQPSGINQIGYQYLTIQIPLNQYFTYQMTLNDGVVALYINGSLVLNGQTMSPTQVVPSNHLYYFKAGNYDQTATNGNVNVVPYTVVQFKSINVYHSNNADLSSLTLSSGSLSQAFASDTTSYTSSVTNSVNNVTVTASVYDSNATMTVNGTPVISGQASSAINLNVGSNVIPIVVTALNGTTKTYSVTVNRASAPSSNADLSSLTLSSGTLSQAFASDTTSYTSTVASDESNITLTASVYDSNATMTVNGTPVISGQASSAINLNVGSNVIPIVVTAQNGTTKTYSVTVNRASSGSSPSPSSTTPSDIKVTATDGKLTLSAGKTGEVSLDDKVVVSIPANATDKDLKITIEKLADTHNLLVNNEVLVSSVFEILKNFSENFNNPVTLTFAFDQASLKNNQTVKVFYYDEAKKVWVEVAGGKINGNKITAEVNHFTKYAVFAVDKLTGKPTPAVNLSDIAGYWAEANIKQAVSSGIVSGYPDGTFRPKHTVTRAEFTVMLMNALQEQGDGAALTFTDAAEIGAWAQKAVAQAFQAGIIKGNEDGSFRPNAEITRVEMAVMLANALKLTLEANPATGFADDKDVPAWAKGAVAALKKQKLVEGKDANQFAPTASTTRAEAVTVILNMLTQKSK